MHDFTESRGIEQVKTAPGHPGPNNAETVMKPLGKAMKIGHANKIAEKETLSSFLVSYRDTPHSSTGVSPAAMLFRDGYRSQFPHNKLTESAVLHARSQDRSIKNARKSKFNSARHTAYSPIQQGDHVLVRNYRKKSKFHPEYLPDIHLVMDVTEGNIFIIQNLTNNIVLKRHPDDLKIFHGNISAQTNEQDSVESFDAAASWRDAFNDIDRYSYDDFEDDVDITGGACGQAEQPTPNIEEVPRYPVRNRTTNTRIFNEDFDTSGSR